ncbi:terminase small subunit [Pseudomonas abietaniphila]|uniref:Phage DNA packaging protein, Nu1 subunit of terminase n=1 Tax=Pseudomonas abietaniphila TaxID=89065 RepID=A0A1G8LJC1_9PSED|nr:terminase small subunit [Pseudomonas abietaniphila]SDI55829.1 Phage DNA packaging protein, Nu1 subunit of terminase [Pseudomonas abietaniphila]
MAKNETTKQRGWLNKSDMASSLGISPQAFDKWGVSPVARIGREAFYTVEIVVQNRVEHATRKQQPAGGDGADVDALVEYKLLAERLRLTAAQADAQEKKNLVQDKQLVPVPFAAFALAKIAAQIGSKLDTVGKTVSRRHPEVDPRIVESVEREIALARNIAASFGEQLPELLDEYVESVAE